VQLSASLLKSALDALPGNEFLVPVNTVGFEGLALIDDNVRPSLLLLLPFYYCTLLQGVEVISREEAIGDIGTIRFIANCSRSFVTLALPRLESARPRFFLECPL
jgi:hypothetical protein